MGGDIMSVDLKSLNAGDEYTDEAGDVYVVTERVLNEAGDVVRIVSKKKMPQ